MANPEGRQAATLVASDLITADETELPKEQKSKG